MLKVNLGSGYYYKEGYVNVDFDKLQNYDVHHDLDKFPYPFKSNSVDLVECDHVLEHLNHPHRVMCEIHRILKPEGKVIVKVPHFSRGFTHSDHKRGFDITFPYYFKEDFVEGYVGCEFKLKSMWLKWFAQPYFKKRVMPYGQFVIAYIGGKIIDFFANLSPTLCSRVWCYWVGGFEEISYTFIKPDKSQGYVCVSCAKTVPFNKVYGEMKEPYCKKCYKKKRR
jgi:SAM-dependent methyltransferase